ncbi:hypothetical protein [Bartonella sp. HY406]|uniref:hypothetical protein n=1 Tax=Bartonella sp. HY406 TaxID=2979331 RepID=UPI0021C896BA|nr:hypothetical protein [Bartonella sp. HY406]UXN04970.1 hypothetical protein N6B01_13910 [Bartonella sp. HY406]
MQKLDDYRVADGIKVEITDHIVHPNAKIEFHIACNGIGVKFQISDAKTYATYGDIYYDSYDDIYFDEDNKLASIRPVVEFINEKAELASTELFGTLSKVDELGYFTYSHLRYFNKEKKYLVGFDKAEDLLESEVVLFHQDFGYIFKNRQYVGWYLQNPLNYLCNDDIKPNKPYSDVRDNEYDVLEMFINTFCDNDFEELYDGNEELAVVLWDRTFKIAPIIKNEQRRKIFIDAARNYYEWRCHKFPDEPHS